MGEHVPASDSAARSDVDELLELGRLFTCGCGAVGTIDELCNFDDAARGCGGTGRIECLCGGDFCICHNHGGYDCDGCEDCDDDIDCCDDDVWNQDDDRP